MSERRVSVNWSSVVDDGVAAAASVEIESWLAGRAEREAGWEGDLGAVSQALERLAATPRIRDDARCQRILAELARRPDLEQLSHALDQIRAIVVPPVSRPAPAAASDTVVRPGTTTDPKPASAGPTRLRLWV